MNPATHSRTVIDALPDARRVARLKQLQAEIAGRLSATASHEEFLRESRAIIDELRALGHDLWSWDYDGKNETWGGDYMHPETAGRLLVMFEFNGSTSVAWWTGVAAATS
jgi:hypothetical protein